MSGLVLYVAYLMIIALFGLLLASLVTNVVGGWRPLSEHHPSMGCCPRWMWLWESDWTIPCYHVTPDGPRCCHCGRRPPKEKPRHGNNIMEFK